MSNAGVVETNEQSTEIQPAAAERKGLVPFLESVRAEMKRVHTPSREEVRTGTITVIATVFVFAAYFWLVDVVLGVNGIDKALQWLIKH